MLDHEHLLSAVLKGIEDFKLRGKQGAEMVQKVEELTKKHLQVCEATWCCHLHDRAIDRIVIIIALWVARRCRNA